MGPPSGKKRKLSVEPSAQQERIEALQQVCVHMNQPASDLWLVLQKISSREESLKQPLKFAGAHHMSR